jgi:hypothetical protein
MISRDINCNTPLCKKEKKEQVDLPVSSTRIIHHQMRHSQSLTNGSMTVGLVMFTALSATVTSLGIPLDS